MKLPNCPKCNSEHTYMDREFFVCPECAHEWNESAQVAEAQQNISKKFRDAFGNELQDGDSVIVVKDLKIKGASSSVKIGTKVKNIRLMEAEDGHDIDCKIEGIGAIRLKSSVVKKA